MSATRTRAPGSGSPPERTVPESVCTAAAAIEKSRVAEPPAASVTGALCPTKPYADASTVHVPSRTRSS